METTNHSPENYLASLPEAQQQMLRPVDQALHKLFHDSSRVMWEGKFWGGTEQKIIGYGDYRYTRSDKKEVKWFVIGLTMQKNYASLYVNVVEDKQYFAEKYADQLGNVKVSRSCIRFKKREDLALQQLIKLLKEFQKK